MSGSFDSVQALLHQLSVSSPDRGIPSGRAIPGDSAPSPQALSADSSVGALRDWAALLLDTSGSMGTHDWHPSRLAGAQAAAIEFIDARTTAHPGAHIGVVGFSDTASVACWPVAVKFSLAARRAVSGLVPNGGTNLARGIETALQSLRAATRGTLAGTELVVLTDGHSQSEAVALARADEAKRAGCVIHVVGIGGSPTAVNAKLLEAIASLDPENKPLYRFITERDQLARHFASIGGGITR